jgi:uncharacterized repeat protein (TIGR01451 family)
MKPACRFLRRNLLLAAALVVPTPAIAASPEANLAVALTHRPNPVAGLDQLTYTVIVTNAGPAAATSIKVVNTLPPGAVFGSAGGVGWDCGNPVAGVVTCALPTLAAGARAAFLGIAVTAPSQGGTLKLTATVSAAEGDSAVANNTATESVPVTPKP